MSVGVCVPSQLEVSRECKVIMYPGGVEENLQSLAASRVTTLVVKVPFGCVCHKKLAVLSVMENCVQLRMAIIFGNINYENTCTVLKIYFTLTRHV